MSEVGLRKSVGCKVKTGEERVNQLDGVWGICAGRTGPMSVYSGSPFHGAGLLTFQSERLAIDFTLLSVG